MDDGARKGANRSGKRIHTEGFEEYQVRELCQALNLYGVETTVQKQKRRPFSKKRNLESRDPDPRRAIAKPPCAPRTGFDRALPARDLRSHAGRFAPGAPTERWALRSRRAIFDRTLPEFL